MDGIMEGRFSVAADLERPRSRISLSQHGPTLVWRYAKRRWLCPSVGGAQAPIHRGLVGHPIVNMPLIQAKEL